MGEVWRAEHRLLAKPAAVKLIRPDLLEGGERDAGTARRFEREAQATSLLRSVHTVELYDFGVAPDGRFFYVMELLDGLNAERLVLEHGPQPPGRVVHLLRQACRSLEEAHESGLIHRDIKPANIYVCRFGTDVDFVKLLDFGLVKAGPAQEDTNLTGQGVVAGTPAYGAPEMLRAVPLDGRADLYSLGCVAYWLLTGTPVFRSDSAVSLIVDHARVRPEPPSSRLSRPLPEDLEAVVLRCLAKDPDDRYQTASELDRALAECACGPTWHRGEALTWWRAHMPQLEIRPSVDLARRPSARPRRETFSTRDAS
jgi:serine/threonine-protein kinase